MFTRFGLKFFRFPDIQFAITLVYQNFLRPPNNTRHLTCRPFHCTSLSLHRPLYKSGFTLAELLITLSLLGIIASFSIPKIMGNYIENKNSVHFKKIYSTLNQLFYKANLENELVGVDWPNYLKKNLNYTKWCDEGFNDGCLAEDGFLANFPALVLPNGIVLSRLYNDQYKLNINIHLQRDAGPDFYSEDIIALRGCIKEPCDWDWHNVSEIQGRKYNFVPHDLDNARFLQLMK